MKQVIYDYNKNINELHKLIVKRNEFKNPYNFINKKIKLKDKKGNSIEKKILGIEILSLNYYTNTLDKEATNGFYSNSSNGIDKTSIKKHYNCYDNKLVVLTI